MTFQERFWDRLRSLPCIPLRSELLPLCKFRDPEAEVLTLLSDLHMLPLQFADDCWLPFLRKVNLLKINDYKCRHSSFYLVFMLISH